MSINLCCHWLTKHQNAIFKKLLHMVMQLQCKGFLREHLSCICTLFFLMLTIILIL